MSCRPVVYYVTAHGLGHAARSCDILRAFRDAHPDIPVWLVTDLEPDFFRSRLQTSTFQVRARALDTALLQLDSIKPSLTRCCPIICALRPSI